jgi:alanine racemase
VERPILVLYPIPAALAPDAARRGISVTAGDGDLLDALLASLSDEPPTLPLRVELEVETGLGRGGFLPEPLVAAARRIEAAPGVALDGLWTHFQATEDAAATAASWIASPPPATRSVMPGWRSGSSRGGERGHRPGRLVAYDGVRPGLAIYGLVPDELEGRVAPRSRRRSRRSCRSTLGPSASRTCRRAGGSATGQRSERPVQAASRRCHWATATVATPAVQSAEALVRGMRVPLVGNVAMDAVMADVTDVPGPPVTTDDEFVLLGAQGGARIPQRSWRTVAPRTPGKR